jgi:hypothetical protein
MSQPESLEPGPRLHLLVRGGLIARGYSLTSWGRAHNIKATNIRRCLYGAWDGPAARVLRARLIEDAGLSPGNKKAPGANTPEASG